MSKHHDKKAKSDVEIQSATFLTSVLSGCHKEGNNPDVSTEVESLSSVP
jgi:hypothetical protein